MALQERIRHQDVRIRALEQALDQSLGSLAELRSQSVNQQFLEQQLASTEAFANVQQQAIHQLKLQFAQEKAALAAEIQQLREQEPRQLELLPSVTEPVRPAEEPLDPVSSQQMTQAFFQQAFQELESDRQQSQHRIAELERQAAEMQEQILSQAQQASEYETAVQHWKNRFYVLQDQLQVLKRLLLKNPVILSDEIQTLLATLMTPPTSEPRRTEPLPRVSPLNQTQKLDVAEFLARRRIYRRNSNQN
jgi:chromosome segregation ATPase